MEYLKTIDMLISNNLKHHGMKESLQLSWRKILPTSSSDDAALDASEDENCIHDCTSYI